jgi:hypothetical protein
MALHYAGDRQFEGRRVETGKIETVEAGLLRDADRREDDEEPDDEPDEEWELAKLIHDYFFVRFNADEWFEFRAEALREIAIDFCEEHGVAWK